MADINVKVTFDKINVKEKIQEHKVKILMLKGEKGDTGEAGQSYDDTEVRGLISANTSDISSLQTDVSANTSDILSLQSSVSSNTSDISDLQNRLEFEIVNSMNDTIKDITSLAFVKGKNLLNKDSGFENAYISSTGIITPGNNNALFDQIIRVLPNTSYTISCKQIVYNYAFAIYDENNNFITRRFENSVSSMTQVMPQNAAYIRVQFNYDNVTTITQSIIDTLNVMLVQGPTSVPYEPYVDNQIHIKNKNGVFEEFFEESKLNQENYSLGEQKIGTWINGKPLYRKIYQFNLPQCATSGTAAIESHTINSASFAFIEFGYIYSEFINAPMPYFTRQNPSQNIGYDLTSPNTLRIWNSFKDWNSAKILVSVLYTKTID